MLKFFSEFHRQDWEKSFAQFLIEENIKKVENNLQLDYEALIKAEDHQKDIETLMERPIDVKKGDVVYVDHATLKFVYPDAGNFEGMYRVEEVTSGEKFWFVNEDLPDIKCTVKLKYGSYVVCVPHWCLVVYRSET